MDKILSIIVPAYNMEAYLPKCLGSLIVDDKELLQKLDVIVVNDGSKDRTSEIAHEIEAKYPSVFRVIDKTNGNYGSCINVALKQLHGKFVKILDADDEYDPDGLSRLLCGLNITKADMILSDWVDVSPNHRMVRRNELPVNEIFSTQIFFEKGLIPFNAAITYKTEVLKKINYTQLEGVSYTDLEWDILPLMAVNSIIYLPEIVYLYNVRREGQTSDIETKRKNFWMVLEMYKHLISQYQFQRESIDPSIRQGLDRLIALKGDSFYRQGYIFGAKVNFGEFDQDMKRIAPQIYEMVPRCRISGQKFNFVKAFRRNRCIDKIMIFVYCITMRIYRCFG